MSAQPPEPPSSGRNGLTQRRIFDLFVETMTSDTDAAVEALVVRLKWYGDDIGTAITRLNDDPHAVVALIDSLSRTMQALDQQAGAVDAMEASVTAARRYALLLPDTDIHN